MELKDCAVHCPRCGLSRKTERRGWITAFDEKRILFRCRHCGLEFEVLVHRAGQTLGDLDAAWSALERQELLRDAEVWKNESDIWELTAQILAECSVPEYDVDEVRKRVRSAHAGTRIHTSETELSYWYTDEQGDLKMKYGDDIELEVSKYSRHSTINVWSLTVNHRTQTSGYANSTLSAIKRAQQALDDYLEDRR